MNHTDCIVKHEEADITLISYMLQAAEAGALTIRILSDDTDVFVLLVYWAWKANVQSTVQMEKWNGTSLDINAPIRGLGDRCQGLLGMHALSGCDTASYPCGKGKTSALKVLKSLNTVLGEPDATHRDLKDTGTEFFIALYGQKKAKPMRYTHYQIYSGSKKLPKLKKLPPTDANLMLHILRAHLQVMLWKAAGQREPPAEARDISKFGWEVVKEGAVMPALAIQAVAPINLLDVTSCTCSTLKACSKGNCSCHAASISCTDYCKCEGCEVCCCNPFTIHVHT